MIDKPKPAGEVLCENDSLRLLHQYETVFLVDRATGRILFESSGYGDPECGLLAEGGSWALIGADRLTLWRPARVQAFEDDELSWIHGLRFRDATTVEILTDPWSEHAAIWELDVETFVCRKVRPFPDYRDKEYTDHVEW